MKAYKGFNKDLTCRGYQYHEGKTHKHEGRVEPCRSGFHACEEPLDVLHYYPFNCNTVYYAVDCGGEIMHHNEDSKIACSEITLKRKISLIELIRAGTDMILKKVKDIKFEQHTSGDQSTAATSGDRSTAATSGDQSTAATSGDRSTAATSGYRSTAATSGYRSTAATSGDRSTAATSGDQSTAATSGDQSTAATSGDWSTAATSGDWSTAATSGDQSTAATSGDQSTAATSGYRSTAATSGDQSTAATSGDWSTAATSGDQSTAATSGDWSTVLVSGSSNIGIANGYKTKAKGNKGTKGDNYIILTEYDEDGSILIDCKVAKIDGEKIKEDTFYMLVNGEFVEVE